MVGLPSAEWVVSAVRSAVPVVSVAASIAATVPSYPEADRRLLRSPVG
jgi:hypothetical protein